MSMSTQEVDTQASQGKEPQHPHRQQLGKTFEFIEKIDSGSFGELYHARDLSTSQDVAVKLEKSNAKQRILSYEAKILQFITNQPGCKGFPEVFYCSVEDPYNVMVLELLGPSLEDLFTICNRKFTALTIAMIGLQLTERLEFLHSKYYIHRDIKPDNICIGLGKNSKTLYLIDMAFCKRFIQKDGSHIINQQVKQFTGTVRYASVSAQRNFEQSRRDDLISLAYTLIYLMQGRLPWQDSRAISKREKYEKVLEKKSSIGFEQLCQKLPEDLCEFVKYCFSLEFEQKPDYQNIKKLFAEMIQKNKGENVPEFDWTINTYDIGDQQ